MDRGFDFFFVSSWFYSSTCNISLFMSVDNRFRLVFLSVFKRDKP